LSMNQSRTAEDVDLALKRHAVASRAGRN